MGYTHYHPQARDFTAAEWADVMTAAAVIIRYARRDGVGVAGPLGYGAPVLADGELALNGRAEEAFESFVLTRERSAAYGFTKTVRMPYDVVVTAILLYATRRAPGALSVGSDGDMDGVDWEPARRMLDRAADALPPIGAVRRPVNVAALEDRAASLMVVWEGDGLFSVRSGSDPNTWYDVTAGAGEPDTWTCTCPWAEHGGCLCSHVRAVVRWGSGPAGAPELALAVA